MCQCLLQAAAAPTPTAKKADAGANAEDQEEELTPNVSSLAELFTLHRHDLLIVPMRSIAIL